MGVRAPNVTCLPLTDGGPIEGAARLAEGKGHGLRRRDQLNPQSALHVHARTCRFVRHLHGFVDGIISV
ncbi:MAG: hypothetical protein QMC89_03610 [Candidatus Hodarchaeaceae archaeon]|nr:hypothetical protein [Candidatus Hodarchaeaceae archaeon]